MKKLNINDQCTITGGKKGYAYCHAYNSGNCYKDYSNSAYSFSKGKCSFTYYTAIDYAAKYWTRYYGPCMSCYSHDVDIAAGL